VFIQPLSDNNVNGEQNIAEMKVLMTLHTHFSFYKDKKNIIVVFLVDNTASVNDKDSPIGPFHGLHHLHNHFISSSSC